MDVLNTECDANCDMNNNDLECLKMYTTFDFVEMNKVLLPSLLPTLPSFLTLILYQVV